MKRILCLVLCLVMLMATASASAASITVELFDRNNVPADQGTTTDNRWTKWIQESVKADLDLDVTFVSVPRGEETTQLNVLMASGSAPDIVFTYDRTLVMKYATEGGLVDLTPYMDGMDNLKALSAANDTLSYGVIDGCQYAIPAARANIGHVAPFIRKDWVEKVGMDMPTNRDELVEVLRAFRDQNVSGSENGTIPWSGIVVSMDGYLMRDVAQSFCANTVEEQYCYPLPARPGYKAFAEWMNGLYKEGLIDPEFATHEDNLIRMKEGLSGFFMEGWWVPGGTAASSVCNVLSELHPEAEFVAVDVFQDANGDYYKTCYQPIGMYIMVPATAKDPKACVEYLNWLASTEAGMMLQYGVEGEHYNLEDGVPVVIDAAYNAQTRNPCVDLNLAYNGFPLPDAARDAVQLMENPKFGQMTVDANVIALNDAVPEIAFQVPIESENMYGVELNEAYKTGWVKLMTADDFEAAWATYWADLEAKGINEIIAERTAYYNEYVANK